MFTPKKVAAAGVGAALAATLVVGGLAGPLASAFAAPVDGAANSSVSSVRQSTPNPSPKPAPKPGRGVGPGPQLTPEQRQQRQQELLNRVAANLGVNAQQLQDAFKKARIDEVNRAVSEGRISQDQANKMIERINTGQGLGLHEGGHGPKPGQGPGGGGNPGAREAMRGGMQTAAQALGLTPEQLRQQVQAGKSLAQIGQERGISRDVLKQRLQDGTKQRLDQAVGEGRMTPEQATQVLSRFSANLDRMLDFAPGQRRGPAGPAQQ